MPENRIGDLHITQLREQYQVWELRGPVGLPLAGRWEPVRRAYSDGIIEAFLTIGRYERIGDNAAPTRNKLCGYYRQAQVLAQRGA